MAGACTGNVTIADEQLSKVRFGSVAWQTEALSELRDEVVGERGEGLRVVGIHSGTFGLRGEADGLGG